MTTNVGVVPTGNGLNARESELLIDLSAFARSAAKNPEWHPQWARPLDVGGRNGSHHSYTLNKLARRGLVEVRQRPHRGSKTYRITDFGNEVAAYLQSGMSAIKYALQITTRRGKVGL